MWLCHMTLKKDVFARRHCWIVVICSRTLYYILYSILVESNTIDYPTLTGLILSSLFGWLVGDGWCWFVLREEYSWLVADGLFVVREKYCWLVADKPSEQGDPLRLACGEETRSRGRRQL
jgi:hypothetical protein